MAAPDTKIDFTIGDQERLMRMETYQEETLRLLKHLPCQPEAIKDCPQGDRIVAIERRTNSIASWVTGLVATLLAGGMLALVSAVLTHLAK
jgi:hypothetical protein